MVCPQCGRQISDRAAVCPACDRVVDPNLAVIDPAVGARQHRMLFAGLFGRRTPFVKVGLILIAIMVAVPLIVGIFFRR